MEREPSREGDSSLARGTRQPDCQTQTAAPVCSLGMEHQWRNEFLRLMPRAALRKSERRALAFKRVMVIKFVGP